MLKFILVCVRERTGMLPLGLLLSAANRAVYCSSTWGTGLMRLGAAETMGMVSSGTGASGSTGTGGLTKPPGLVVVVASEATGGCGGE